MKWTRLFVDIAAMLPLALSGIRVAELPFLTEGTMPNSEVATNFPLRIDIERLDSISFDISLDSSDSNCFFVAIGKAAGEMLTLEETDVEWGYDCGSWVFADGISGEVRSEIAADTSSVSGTLVLKNWQINPCWNMIRAVKRGTGDLHVNADYTVDFKKFSMHIR